MSYYRGDGGNYYQGDYYKGDPFLGGLIAAGARRIVAPLARKAGRWIGRQTVGGAIAKTGGAIAAGSAATAVTRSVSRGMPIEIDPGAFLPGGSPFVSVGERKKYRRMNPLNPRALKRALRRAEGFEKFARKTMSALYKPGSSRKYRKTTRAA